MGIDLYRTWVRSLLALVLLSSVPLHAQSQAIERSVVEVQTKRSFGFPDSGVSFSNDFPGARLNDCTQVGESHFRILIRPENFPINNSPWFAFRVVSQKKKTITVTLAYEKGQHRYHPKISHDRVKWTLLGANAYRRDREANEAVLVLSVGPKPLWVSAQELMTAKELNAWMDKMDRSRFIKKTLVGHSMLNRPIQQIEITEAQKTNYVFIIGRQHPPEVTGSFGLIAFTETIAGNSRLAKEFRRHFRTIVIPLMNPDGVENGHWRHNMGGVDLNRDWIKLAQPETQLVSKHLKQIGNAPGARPFFMLDFHSTQRDLFYTQSDSEKTFPENFTTKWLAAIQQRFSDYKLVREGSHDPRSGTSKVWGYVQFGVPCITYELGDSTDRKRIRQIASGAAEEMMRLLLAEVK